MLQFDLDSALKEIKRRKAKNVALQVPEGLKARLPEIIATIEDNADAKAFAFVQPCFGACDVKDMEAKALGADMLLHFGHSQFVEGHAIETIYVPVECKADGKAISLLAGRLAAELKKKGSKRIALCATIQFKKHLAMLEQELNGKGFEAFVGKGKGVERGQVVGCNYSSVKGVEGKVEAVAFVGDGLFHPLGLGFAVKRPVFVLDPVQKEVKEILQQRDLFLRKRIAMIEKVKQAKSIGIWVSTKRGQQRMPLAERLRKGFERQGKKVFVFVSDFVKPDYVAGVDVEAIVCTDCPRIAFDDSSLFKQPIVNQVEAMIALGEKKLGEYAFDELA